jgi:hypothetical protein
MVIGDKDKIRIMNGDWKIGSVSGKVWVRA